MIGEKYMFGINETLMRLVKHNLENGEVPMLLGSCGIDKPAWAEMLADSMDTKCFTRV